MGLEELISLSISGGVTRVNWERWPWGGGLGRSREMGGEIVVVDAGGDVCVSDAADRERLMAVILSEKNWRNELHKVEVEEGRVSAQGLRSLLTVGKRVLGLREGSVKMVER